MNHASVLHKRATLRKISIKVFINQHHHKPNAWCSGSAQQSYLHDPGLKPRCEHGIHEYKIDNTSSNHKKWWSAVERWVSHIIRNRDRIPPSPLFLLHIFPFDSCYSRRSGTSVFHSFFFTTGGPARQRRKQRGLQGLVPWFFFSLFLFNKAKNISYKLKMLKLSAKK